MKIQKKCVFFLGGSVGGPVGGVKVDVNRQVKF